MYYLRQRCWQPQAMPFRSLPRASLATHRTRTSCWRRPGRYPMKSSSEHKRPRPWTRTTRRRWARRSSTSTRKSGRSYSRRTKTARSWRRVLRTRLRIRVATGSGVEAQVVAVAEAVAGAEARGGARERAQGGGGVVMAQANAALAGLKTG